MALAIDDDAWTRFTDLDKVFVSSPAVHADGAVADAKRWREAARRGELFFGCDVAGQPVGMLALGVVDDRPYLGQLSVARAWAGRGVGTKLLALAKLKTAGAGELWLTTYRSIPWNAPWYRRHGFELVPDADCGPAIRGILAEQRSVLPYPEDRVGMVYRHSD